MNCNKGIHTHMYIYERIKSPFTHRTSAIKKAKHVLQCYILQQMSKKITIYRIQSNIYRDCTYRMLSKISSLRKWNRLCVMELTQAGLKLKLKQQTRAITLMNTFIRNQLRKRSKVKRKNSKHTSRCKYEKVLRHVHIYNVICICIYGCVDLDWRKNSRQQTTVSLSLLPTKATITNNNACQWRKRADKR